MRELVEWQEFEKQNGPILLHERIDAAAALVALTVNRSAEGKAVPDAELADFLPDWSSASAPQVAAQDFLHAVSRSA